MSVARPATTSATALPDPHAIDQPSGPWPVLTNRFSSGVRPMIGMPSGVSGRNPHQGFTSMPSADSANCGYTRRSRLRRFAIRSGRTAVS